MNYLKIIPFALLLNVIGFIIWKLFFPFYSGWVTTPLVLPITLLAVYVVAICYKLFIDKSFLQEKKLSKLDRTDFQLLLVYSIMITIHIRILWRFLVERGFANQKVMLVAVVAIFLLLYFLVSMQRERLQRLKEKQEKEKQDTQCAVKNR